MLFDRREPPQPANSNPRDAVEHDDVGTPVWPQPVRRDRALWSHECIAAGRRIWKSRAEPCEACGAREMR